MDSQIEDLMDKAMQYALKMGAYFAEAKGEDLIGELKDGVLVKGSLIGAFHSNAVTGDFSVTADNAFKIENGKLPIRLSHALLLETYMKL